MTSEVNSREKCYEFCKENRIETKATCCGMKFHVNTVVGKTSIGCGLYFADIVDVDVTIEDQNEFHYYTAIELGQGLREKFEDVLEIARDTQKDWGNSASLLQIAGSMGLIISTFA